MHVPGTFSGRLAPTGRTDPLARAGRRLDPGPGAGLPGPGLQPGHLFNLPKVQKGLRASVQGYVNFGAYQETKIRHFHMLLEKFISR
jgi:hypothetical protein